MAVPATHFEVACPIKIQTARKVPGSFGFDDPDDLSPTKDRFEESQFINSQAAAQNYRLPSLDPATLPSLPPPRDSSLLYHHSEHGSERHFDSSAQMEMQRHLNDVESSFLPAVSPIGASGKESVDDTFLFDQANGRGRGQMSPLKEADSPRSDSRMENGGSLPSTPLDGYMTPNHARAGTPHAGQTSELGHTTSSLETLSSSPTAAAAARTVSRAISGASVITDNTEEQEEEMEEGEQEGEETGEEEVQDVEEEEEEAAKDSQSQNGKDHEADQRTPRQSIQKLQTSPASVKASTVRNKSHDSSLNYITSDAGETLEAGTLHRQTSGKAPKFLRTRNTSQTSSSSSYAASEDGGSDVTVGADYALQSGGAVPLEGISRNLSIALSRSISLGSMASNFEQGSAESSGCGEPGLATLTEEEQSRERSDDMSSVTPRATTTTLAAPTDTVIARHVRNVRVPESLAREYRDKTIHSSPEKKFGLTNSTLGRGRKNLTLKEQSSTIERLSKENFDLKLKVMFLSDRLDKLSEEGVRETISENVELKTGLAVIQRDNKALRKRVKDLEQQLKDEEVRSSATDSAVPEDEIGHKWSEHETVLEREEELLWLREQAEQFYTDIEKLREEAVAREGEKRNLAELVRNMGERRGRNPEAREEMDFWKDLLEQETARKEQVDDDNKRLREEIFRMKTDSSSSTVIPGLSHTTSIFNVTKKRQTSPLRSKSVLSNAEVDGRNGAFSAASTLVDELRKESEQLRHENAELRREVGAQTSMLTSRNREKERLYQEIEDLKLGQRRGGSVAGDSIFERSASRSHMRSLSRKSDETRQSCMTDPEREELENRHAQLRDRVNSLKVRNQTLQRELKSCMHDFEKAVEQKKEGDDFNRELREALETAEGDLITMQSERDEALRGQEETELMFEQLRKEAQDEIDGYGADGEEAGAEINRLQTELADANENFNALQNEMREMSEGVVRLEDDTEKNMRRIQDLEKELEDANQELEQMEKNLVEAHGKINRLTVQQESSQGEIAFLREEQDGDKIKIGDLEAAIKHSEQSLQGERDIIHELEQRIIKERQQREQIAGKEKQEVQHFVNELNREASSAKDEARKLRKSLTSREVEVAEWKGRLVELENNLREALGDLNGTRSSLLNSIAKLQHELEKTTRELDSTKAALTERERVIKQRDGLLETHGLESRKLADMLDKERQVHRATRNQFEAYQRSSQHTTRTLTQQEARVLELEHLRQQDRRKKLLLENSFKDQLTERNNLLLALWGRLSALCGSDWTHNNSLINGRALPSLEAVSTMLPGFSKNLLAAIKTIESLAVEFRSHVKDLDKRLWKEYQNLEARCEHQTKKIDKLETMARSSIPQAADSNRADVTRLKDINRTLKAELSSLRAANDVRAGVYAETPSPSPSVPTGPRDRQISQSRTPTLTRHHSPSAVENFERERQRVRSISSRTGTLTSLSGRDRERGREITSVHEEDYKPDLRWQIRLQEMELKLKAEREGRKLDRSSARQRLEEKSRENEELGRELGKELARAERERERGGGGGSGSGVSVAGHGEGVQA